MFGNQNLQLTVFRISIIALFGCFLDFSFLPWFPAPLWGLRGFHCPVTFCHYASLKCHVLTRLGGSVNKGSIFTERRLQCKLKIDWHGLASFHAMSCGKQTLSSACVEVSQAERGALGVGVSLC